MSWRRGGKLKLVGESEAQGRTSEIFQEIKQALGVPHVNVIFQAWAAYPAFLELHWQALKPAVETGNFFALAERLRADAYTRTHNYFPISDLGAQLEKAQLSAEDRQAIEEVVELFNYNNPLLLLMASAQLQALETHTGSYKPATPAEHPVYDRKPELVEEEAAPERVRRIYDDIRRTLGLPFINTDYRAFARWPDFLEIYWRSVKPTIESPLYVKCQLGLRESAWVLAHELPAPMEMGVEQLIAAGLDEDDITSVTRITELFVRTLSGLVLNVAFAKVGLEGGNRQLHTAEPEAAAGPSKVA